MLEMYRRDQFKQDLLIEQCLEVISLEERLRETGDLGAPIVASDPDAESAKVLQQIADQLSGRSRGLAGMQLGLAPAGRL